MRRRLTVSALRREWGPLHRMRTAYVPSIRLNGQWLEQAGFEVGQKIRLAVEENAILIQPETRPE